jgi:hypothetical protein
MARGPTTPLTPSSRHSTRAAAHGGRRNPYSPSAAIRRLQASYGQFVFTGIASASIPQFLPANSTIFSVTSADAGLLFRRIQTSDYGSFSLAGQAATLTYSGSITPTYTLTADYGQYYAYGDPGPSVVADYGSFSYTGQSATLTFLSSISDYGAFTFTGQSATLTYTPSSGNNLQDELGNNILDALGGVITDAA